MVREFLDDVLLVVMLTLVLSAAAVSAGAAIAVMIPR
jgi:hypothetical protein